MFSRTPSAKVPGFTALHLLPERGFRYAVLFSNKKIIKSYLAIDSLNGWFYLKASDVLQKSPYIVKYSQIVKNAIGKYVLYAGYVRNHFMLITRPRFRLKLLRGFIGGEKKVYNGIVIKRIGKLYFYFVEDFLVMTDDIDLLRNSLDIALGKKRGSVFDEVGGIDEYDFVLLLNAYQTDLVKIQGVIIEINQGKILIKGNLESSVIKDAIKRGSLCDSIPYSGNFVAIKLPYLELYDAYVSHYPEDELNLSAVLWDIGGTGFLWYEPDGHYLISLSSRVEKERLMRDIFTYLKEKGKSDMVLTDPSMNLYYFTKRADTVYILKTEPALNQNMFVFTNSVKLFNEYEKAQYIKDDGRMHLANSEFLNVFVDFPEQLKKLLDFYVKSDSLIPSEWKLELKEYKESIFIKGKRVK